MYSRSPKKQVQHSLTRLSGALFALLRSKGIADITITELCARAEVTRTTFYRNCAGKEDLILFSTDWIVGELLRRTDFASTDALTMYTTFFSFWADHREFLTLIEKNGMFSMFLDEFTAVCSRSMRYPLQESWVTETDDATFARSYSNAFVIGGLGQMLQRWVRDGFDHEPEELASTILYLTPAFSDGRLSGYSSRNPSVANTFRDLGGGTNAPSS